jgi:uncharacterized protein YgiM (DUF1202 family)
VLKFVFGMALLFVWVPACSAFPAANPTPIIIVVTATPGAPSANARTSAPNATPTILSDTTAVPATGAQSPQTTVTASSAFSMKPTSVQFVRAKQDINIRAGPGTNYDIVGGVYAGQTAKVTGFTSADEKWWRVTCPDDRVGDCWVSADPALTEPVVTPNTTATRTPGVEGHSETLVRALAAALQGKNFDALGICVRSSWTSFTITS